MYEIKQTVILAIYLTQILSHTRHPYKLPWSMNNKAWIYNSEYMQNQIMLTSTGDVGGELFLQCTLYKVTFWTTNISRNWRTQDMKLNEHLCTWGNDRFDELPAFKGETWLFPTSKRLLKLCMYCSHALLPVSLPAEISKVIKSVTHRETPL